MELEVWTVRGREQGKDKLAAIVLALFKPCARADFSPCHTFVFKGSCLCNPTKFHAAVDNQRRGFCPSRIGCCCSAIVLGREAFIDILICTESPSPNGSVPHR